MEPSLASTANDGPGEDAETLRTAVLGAAVLLLAATGAGMALGRRWFGLGEVLAWAGLGVAALAVVAVLGARGPAGVVGARLLAGAGAVLGGPAVAAACLVVAVATVRHPASRVVPAGLRSLPPSRTPRRPRREPAHASGPPTAPLPALGDQPTERLPAVRDQVWR
ncbi:hypothetical protein [Kineosporia sp. A_224]|uniref:hypothetical protein n=1 Tax=Kineosporia sp. A_224 TaxID=1962180 RepID=UPI000B4B47DD|nr:hypothetical protein [Kineosporia sp. A_224]